MLSVLDVRAESCVPQLDLRADLGGSPSPALQKVQHSQNPKKITPRAKNGVFALYACPQINLPQSVKLCPGCYQSYHPAVTKWW